MDNQELTPATAEAFKKQFGQLHDAVIHHISMDLFSRVLPYHITITLGAKISPDAWVNLNLRFEDVAHFELQRSPMYTFAVVSGALIDFFDGYVCMDFEPYVMHHTSFKDVARPAGSKGPMCIVVSKRCYVSITPYQDRDRA